jgi:hypothetical protein
MFKKLKSLFTSKEVKETISEKDQATARGEPYVKVMSVQLNDDEPGNGYFELDWNQLFVQKLIESGYTGNSQEEIVDQWFTELCRNISGQEF